MVNGISGALLRNHDSPPDSELQEKSICFLNRYVILNFAISVQITVLIGKRDFLFLTFAFPNQKDCLETGAPSCLLLFLTQNANAF